MHRELAEELKAKFADVLMDGIFSAGREVDELENGICRLLGLTSAIACSNGTDALELALQALGIGQGDEVIIPALTWVSTAEAVVNVGASPVYCDVDEEGLIAIPLIEKCLSRHTKAIIPVHLYGKMVAMPQLMAFARNHGLKVIEDAAQAFGAFQEGKSAGTFGDIGCFSFYPTKNLGALGEAGLLTTQEEELDIRLRRLLNHGQSARDVHELMGRNSKTDSLQAAFLNVKLKYFERWQETRKKLALVYLNELEGVNEIISPQSILNIDHNAHLFTVRVQERTALSLYLEQQGIGTAVHYPLPVPLIKAFHRPGGFPMAEKISNTTLSLPLHPYLTEGQVLSICRELKRFYGK